MGAVLALARASRQIASMKLRESLKRLGVRGRIASNERVSRPHCNVLFRGDQGTRCSYALPVAVDFDPGVHESFAVLVRFSFIGAFCAKHSDHYCGVAVNLYAALLGHGLRWLIVGRFDTRQEFAFGLK